MASVRAGIYYDREPRPARAHTAVAATVLKATSKITREYLPYVQVSAYVAIINTTSRTVLTQIFSNETDGVVEKAAYCFPLYHFSVITSFRCWHGTEVIEGKVKPKETAKSDFSRAVNDGQATAILEGHTSEIFETGIGNIPAGADVKIEITYLTELKADISGDGLLLTIPTSIAPRYGEPSESYSTSVTSKCRSSLERGMKIHVDISLSVPIAALRSRTHPISFEMGSSASATTTAFFRSSNKSSARPKHDARKARAVLSGKEATLKNDFVLVIKTAPSDDEAVPDLLSPRAIMETCEQYPALSAIQVAFMPRDLLPLRKDLPTRASEIILLVDCSGSMGSKMESLKRALNVFLSSVPEGCHFNICTFGTNFKTLWGHSKPLNQSTLREARQHVDNFDADMGGTEIKKALYETTRKTRRTATTQVVVFTDGEVSDVNAVVAYVNAVKERYGDVLRFFALGIGDEVSHQLIEGIGKFGGGFAEVVAVHSSDQWDERVSRLLKGVFTASDWKIQLKLKDNRDNMHATSGFLVRKHSPSKSSGNILQMPYHLPILHGFSRTVIYLLVDASADSYKAVSVEGKTPEGEKFDVELPIEHVTVSEPICHQLAAKALLTDLELGYSVLHDSRLVSKVVKVDPAALDQEINLEAEYIAMKWGLASKWTSIVAISDQSSADMTSSFQKHGYDRRELSELTKPRKGNHLFDNAATKKKEYSTIMEESNQKLLQRENENESNDGDDDSGKRKKKSKKYEVDDSHHKIYRWGDDSEDKDHQGGSGGHGPSGSSGPSGGGSRNGQGGGSSSGHGDLSDASGQNRGSGRANGGPSDASESFIMEELNARSFENGALFDNDPGSFGSDRVSIHILKCFSEEVMGALEWIVPGIPKLRAKDRKRVCFTVLCIAYIKRALAQTAAAEQLLDRADRWLQHVVKRRTDRVNLEIEAGIHWIGESDVELKIEPNLDSDMIDATSEVPTPCEAREEVSLEHTILNNYSPSDTIDSGELTYRLSSWMTAMRTVGIDDSYAGPNSAANGPLDTEFTHVRLDSADLFPSDDDHSETPQLRSHSPSVQQCTLPGDPYDSLPYTYGGYHTTTLSQTAAPWTAEYRPTTYGSLPYGFETSQPAYSPATSAGQPTYGSYGPHQPILSEGYGSPAPLPQNQSTSSNETRQTDTPNRIVR